MRTHTPLLCLVPLVLALSLRGSARAQDGARAYRITGEEAWEVAHRTGFEFHPVIPDEGHLLSGRRDGIATHLKACDTPTDPCRVVARIEAGALVVVESECVACERAHDFTLFDGRDLAEGWTVREVRIEGTSWSWIRPPAIDSGHLGFTVRVTAGPDRPTSVSVDAITLRGPPDADWRDAFARGR